jgi:hypothetical protein
VCGGSVSVFICDLYVRWLCDACVRLLLAGIASYFRVSVAESAAPVLGFTCPNRVHRIKNRAVRLVPQCPDFLEKVLTHFAAILSLLPLENGDKKLRPTLWPVA